jgi:hypothetical protein
MKKFTLKDHHLSLTDLVGCQDYGNWDMVKTAVPGTRIRAADWNAEFLKVIASANPAGLASAASDDITMQKTLNPFPGGNPEVPHSLCAEIREIRYQLSAITGETYWYEPPAQSIKDIVVEDVTGGDDHNHLGVATDPDFGGGALITGPAIANNTITRDKLAFDFGVVQSEYATYDTWHDEDTGYILDLYAIPTKGTGLELFSIEITPLSLNSYLVIEASLTSSAVDGTIGALYRNAGSGDDAIFAVGGGTDVTEADTNGSFSPVRMLFIDDTHTTLDPITYSVEVGRINGGQHLFVNRFFGASDGVVGVGHSTLIVREIGKPAPAPLND